MNPEQDAPPEAPPGNERAIPLKTGVAFFFAVISVQLSMEYISQYGPYFLHPPEGTGRTAYVGLGLIAVVFFCGRLFDAVTDPLVGLWSDRLPFGRARRLLRLLEGKRRPFIFWGSLALAGTLVAFWYPPRPAESSANFVYAFAVLLLHWAFLTCCAVPLYALVPDIARTKQTRVALGAWIGAGTTAGVFIAIAVAGELIPHLDPARNGTAEFAPNATEAFSPAGYQRVAWIFALLSLAAFQFLVWTVKEPDEKASTAQSPWKAVQHALTDRRFLHYFLIFLLFNIGFLAPQRVLPHWVEVALGGDESTVAWVLLPFIGSSLAVAMLAPTLARWLTPKHMMILSLAIMTVGLPWMYVIGVAALSHTARLHLAQILFGFTGIGNGLLYVIVFPLLGAIIDRINEERQERTEALLFALNNITWKAGTAFSVVVAMLCLDWLGDSVSNPTGILMVGPVGAVFSGGALVAALNYDMGGGASDSVSPDSTS